MTKYVNVAVVGYGYWGPNLVRNFNQIDGGRLYSVCDLNENALRVVKKMYPGVTVTQNFDDIANNPEIDAVALATPLKTHYPMGKEALLKGKHCLIEKPLTSSSAEAEELIELAERNNCVLMVGHTFEYDSAVIKVKELIKQGKVGDIYYIDSSRLNLGLHRFDANVIWDLAPHDLSIILFWLDMSPSRVSAFGGTYIRKGIADVAFINLEFPRNIMAHIHLSWLAPSKLRRTTVIGSERMVVYDDLESIEVVKVYDRSAKYLVGSDAGKKLETDYRVGDVTSPHVENVEPLRLECSEFIEAIRGKKKPKSDGYDGLRVVKILEAADRSMRNKGKVEEIR